MTLFRDPSRNHRMKMFVVALVIACCVGMGKNYYERVGEGIVEHFTQ